MRETKNEGISRNFFTIVIVCSRKELSLLRSQICETNNLLFKDILAIDFGDVRILHSTVCISSTRSFQILVVRGGEIEKVRRSVTLVVILLWIGQL